MPPILCAHLLAKVDGQLIELLRSLTAKDWEKPTLAPRWNVKQVAAHLLDTPLRKLSMVRDGCYGEKPAVHSAADLKAFIDSLNAQGVAVYGRLSPSILISWIERVTGESAAFHEALDPFAVAAFAVSWAGEEVSLNWFDTARELTERWHHQEQIRLAVGRPGIMTPELYHPVLDCFFRGLPHHYHGVDAPASTAVQVEVSGECGGTWRLQRGAAEWSLVEDRSTAAAARLVIPQEIAWRVFTKGILRAEAAAQTRVDGDSALAEHALTMTSIVG